MENILSLETMKEGHDGSGLGLVLKNLGGQFEEFKDYPIFSAACSNQGLETIKDYLKKEGFQLKLPWEPETRNDGVFAKLYRRDHYIAYVYDYPEAYREKSQEEKDQLLLKTRVALRAMGEADESIFAFSFYPDVVTLKKVGDPLMVGEFFNLQKDRLKAKIIFAQGRQNTNYQIVLYACHPFFIQGYCTMTNGENTAFVPIREYLMSRGFPGYIGYNSDSEVFTHILHYVCKILGYPLTYYKDVITPIKDSEMDGRRDAKAIRLIKKSLRPLCIDGPNCVIGFTPDGSVFMVQDAKKLRPGVVGGRPGLYALTSEECGLAKLIPNRATAEEIYPMKYDMVIVTPEAREVKVWNQLQG
jgi:glutamate synthase domain-containing protein 1